MLKLMRVDHRLIHGQVAFSWTKVLDADCILIASDELMTNELRMSAMRMARPNSVKLVMKNMEDSIKALNSGVTDKYKLFILVESIEDARRLITACPQIKSLNLGGTKKEDDRRQIAKAIFVSEEDEKSLEELAALGVELEVRLVPTDNKQDAIALLKQ